MTLQLLSFLILFPLAIALIVALNRKSALFPYIVHPASLVLIVASCLLLGLSAGGRPTLVPVQADWVEPVMLVAECLIALYLLWLAVKQRDLLVGGLLVLQTTGLLLFHFGVGHSAHAKADLFIDLFSVIMGLIAGVIGSLIAIFAVGYMKDFHQHHPEVPDNRPAFFGLIFLFLSAMFGVCFSNNLLWLFFFWEITTACSFLLIRYKGDEQSVRNAFWALRWNLLGGLAFLMGIIYLFRSAYTIELDQMVLLPKMLVLLPVALISFAGMTKSAQLPFSSWLVGAMVAPTPVSALLHSSTMVKAGVYIILRFASSLEGTILGTVVALVGGITFLIGSFICISQNDAKKVLAYSTIANLGLVVLCSGIGTSEALWAGMLLIIFHAISKGLLFLCVGTIEHQIGSRQIEDMTGLIMRLPKISVMLQIGIAGMFLAPFGMLISKWVILRAIVDYNPLFAIILAYGGAATLFFWVKWLGKILIIDRTYEDSETGISKDQWAPMAVLSVMTILICAFFSPVAQLLIEPYVNHICGKAVSLSSGNIFIMSIMLTMLCLFPLTFFRYGRGVKVVEAYMAGANTEEGVKFRSSMGEAQDMDMRNYYLSDYFGEERLMRLGVLLGIGFLVSILMIGVV